MRAAVLTDYDVFDVRDVADPTIMGATEVIVRVSGAGVCGSDVHLAEGALRHMIGEIEFPFVLGHENAGHVAAVGDAVTTLQPGDPVLLHPHISCGVCRACRRGDETYCENLRFPGVDGTPGGYAEYVKTDVRAAIKLPEGTDPTELAAVTDAGLTAYRAVRKVVDRLPPDGTALVTGVGGVGSFALQILRQFTPATIIALDRDAGRLEVAAGLGADAIVPGGEGEVDAIMSATDGAGVDLVMDCVGAPGTPETSMAVLRRGGRIAQVGSGEGELCCAAGPMTFRELSFEGSLVGTLGELTELIGIALRGRVQMLQTYYPLEQAAAAVEDLRAGRIQGRAVLRP
jgi:D-arabinose 1-dehydrogenase-like Zn-dependent alcohol dehydrogenase